MTLTLVLLAGILALVGYSWLETGWLRRRVVVVEVRGLPEALDGMTIGHLSDFHLGAPLSRGGHATERAVDWVQRRRPDLVCITGDLVSHPRGEQKLRTLLARLERPFVVLGNHDVAVTRDPFSRAAEIRDLERARLLRDESETVLVHGEPVSIVGVDPAARRDVGRRPEDLADPAAVFRVLLCHFPRIVDDLEAGVFDLVLAGHLHGGQICVPWPSGRFTLAHPRARFVAGLYEADAALLHISPGTGTTFVPFRFLARPEATELVLRRLSGGRGTGRNGG
ncbi:MAG TPA: metallophosphoesterase [Gaiella sp.]|nr:metallophosphoesterase [Gaiella sp.]